VDQTPVLSAAGVHEGEATGPDVAIDEDTQLAAWPR
jgi:hypothetical protein